MIRDLNSLAGRKFDVVVVGGGIVGACVAWDSALRGLSVALVERGDFAHATSGNCFKMVHGGIRYLQHADIWRTREAIRERRTLLRIAPHLVKPIPIVIPTYRHGFLGKAYLGAGALLYDLISIDRNRGVRDPSRRIPRSRAQSKDECTRLFPALKREGLTGGVVIYEGQMHNPTRLALEFIRSASEYGAQVANYVEVTGLQQRKGRITGLTARDLQSGQEFEILASVVVNATGPWASQVLKNWLGISISKKTTFSRDMFLLLKRNVLGSDIGVGIPSRGKDPDAILSRGARHLFILPWRGRSLVGVWHKVHDGAPGVFGVTEKEVQLALDEVNSAFTSMELSTSDVARVHSGLVPLSGSDSYGSDVHFGRRSIIADHGELDGEDGLITVIGVRYTTARHVAEDVTDLIFRHLGYEPPPCKTAEIRLRGGNLGRIDEFASEMEDDIKERKIPLDTGRVGSLLRDYGVVLRELVRDMGADPTSAERLDGSNVTKAEVLHSVRTEMAQRLEDIALRRTDMCLEGYPGDVALRMCAEVMAQELTWNDARIQEELSSTRRFLASIENGEYQG